jgi:methyl-accepting chemotaxis protein
VAEEVRNLAQRSAAAAKDTTELIEDSLSKAEAGTKLSEKCNEVLTGIVSNVKKVTSLINEVSSASNEQTEGIDQVGKALQQMDEVTQQNAANAEETASASEEMSAQAQTLKDQINILAAQVGGKVDEGSNSHEKSPVHTSRQIAYRHDVKPTTSVKGNDDHAPEALLPMGENRITEHDEKLKDF